MDNLTMEMRLCEKAGFGVHYGRWKATQPNRVKPKEVIEDTHMKKCPYCEEDFYPGRANQVYCNPKCAQQMRYRRNMERKYDAEKARHD